MPFSSQMTQTKVSKPTPRVICVGDPILDIYQMGRFVKIAQEASVPVVQTEGMNMCPGGAANTAVNIAAQRVQTTFVTVLGKGRFDQALREALEACPNLEFLPVMSDAFRLVTKERFSINGEMVLRVDDDGFGTIDKITQREFLETISARLAGQDCLVLSDYAKGALDADTTQCLIKAATSKSVEVIVDPKGPNFRKYLGATCLTPNRDELEAAAGVKLHNLSDIETAAQTMLANLDVQTMIVTLGAQGVLVCSAGKPAKLLTQPEYISATQVTGAGDTFIAVYTSERAKGSGTIDAARRANAAASLAVQEPFTSVISPTQIDAGKTANISPESLVVGDPHLANQAAAVELCRSWRTEGHVVGFTNGCFDLMHAGHLSLFKEAKKHCSKLIVGLNSDSSVARLKGVHRPIIAERDRLEMLSIIKLVDAVVVFEEDTPIELINALKPHILIKGQDYARANIVGADEVEAEGGKVVRAKMVEGISTTSIIDKIRSFDSA